MLWGMHWSAPGKIVNQPRQLRQLPLNLYRSQDTFKYKGAVGAEIQHHLDNPSEMPIYVPSRMYLTKWTKPRALFGANTVAMLQALHDAQRFQTDMQDAALNGVPVMDWYAAADHVSGSNLPSLARLSDQNYDAIPGPANGLPSSAFIDPRSLVAAIRANRPV